MSTQQKVLIDNLEWKESFLGGGILRFSLPGVARITAYAYVTKEGLTAPGAVLVTGTITDGGVRQGRSSPGAWPDDHIAAEWRRLSRSCF